LLQWEYQDSAGYALPYDPSNLILQHAVNSSAALTIHKYSGYIQNNWLIPAPHAQLILQTGLRFNYNDLNNEFLISPRVQTSWKPDWKRDIIFKAAVGMYDQPPFYREL